MNECADELTYGLTLIVVHIYLLELTCVLTIVFLISLNDTELGDSFLFWLTDNFNTIVKTELGKVPTFLVG